MKSIDDDLSLARILWIGGATDAGKTTPAKLLAERNGFQLYHYDKSSGAAARMLRNARWKTPPLNRVLSG